MAQTQDVVTQDVVAPPRTQTTQTHGEGTWTMTDNGLTTLNTI